jgi:hypothetical protein
MKNRSSSSKNVIKDKCGVLCVTYNNLYHNQIMKRGNRFLKGIMLVRFSTIFLRIYYFSFPLIQAKNKRNQNSWITPGTTTSCKYKRELYKELQNNNSNATLASH